MSITLTEARSFLAQAKTAYTNALSVQQVNVNGRSMTRQEIEKLSAEIDKWSRTVRRLEFAANNGKPPSPLGSSLARFN